jgi:hypothetical protein
MLRDDSFHFGWSSFVSGSFFVLSPSTSSVAVSVVSVAFSGSREILSLETAAEFWTSPVSGGPAEAAMVSELSTGGVEVGMLKKPANTGYCKLGASVGLQQVEVKD